MYGFTNIKSPFKQRKADNDKGHIRTRFGTRFKARAKGKRRD